MSGHRPRLLRRKLRRDLRRQRWQVAAVMVTIVLGVALYGASSDAFLNLTASYRATYDRLAFADLTVDGGDQASIAATARATDGVAAVTTRTQADVPFTVAGDHKLLGRLVGLPADGSQPAVNEVSVVAGGPLDPAEPTGVLVETHMADHFHLAPGDTFQVLLADGFTDVTMVGEVASPEYLWPARSRQDIITTPDDFGVVFAVEDLVARAPAPTQVPQVLVRYPPGADAATLDDTLTRAALDAGASDVFTQAEQPSNAALSEDLQGFNELSFLFPLLFLTAAGLATFVLLNRVVHAQRAQIGTLLANGLARRDVARHYVAYGVVIGAAGALVGALLGAVLGRVITGAYTGALSIPDTVVLFHPLTPVVGLAFGLVTGALAAWTPARASFRLTPAEAMRGPVPPGRARASLAERVLPPLRHLPVRWRMSLRGVGRSPRRSASTVIGVVLALTLVLVSWGMIDTTELLVARQFDDIQHNDAQVFFTVPVDDSVVADVAGLDTVSRAESVLTFDVSLANGADRYATQLQAFDPGTAMHTFLGPGDTQLTLPTDGVLLGAAAEGQLGIGVGDPLTVAFPTLGTSVQLPVAGFVDEPFGTYSYASRATVTDALVAASPPVTAEQLASPAVASVMAIAAPGVSSDALRASLSAQPTVAGVLTTRALADMVDQYLALFYVFVGVMLVFGALMAFALIFNTISVNIAERSVELATMRANGMSARRLNRLLTGENLLLTLLAIPLGLVVGILAAAQMMSSFSSDLFSFDLQLKATTPLYAALAMLAVTVVSQWPGLRAVEHLGIASTARERAQ